MLVFFADRLIARSTRDIGDNFYLIGVIALRPGWIVRPEKRNDFFAEGNRYMTRAGVVADYKVGKIKQRFQLPKRNRRIRQINGGMFCQRTNLFGDSPFLYSGTYRNKNIG